MRSLSQNPIVFYDIIDKKTKQWDRYSSDSWITTDHYNDLNLYLFYMHSYKYIIIY